MAPQNLNAMAFPKLTEQITQLARYAGASTKTFSAGETLFHPGDRDPKFFVIRSGEIEIIIRMNGDGHLISVQILNKTTGEKTASATSALFSFVGATPYADWLSVEIEKVEKHFVRTGIKLGDLPRWTLKRQPFLLETSQPGVFAAGDVHSGSVKRVASAVGERSMVVQFVHEYLKTM